LSDLTANGDKPPCYKLPLEVPRKALLTCEGHAAAFLVFEGLIEIGAVSEIRAAVGYEEGDVDLLL
jgi:hypothetical protein